jgi:hypothetical protein
MIDGKPIELDGSSRDLAEKGLLAVIEFNRPRVFDNSEVGDEASDISSEVFLFDLCPCGLTLAWTSSTIWDVDTDGSRSGNFRSRPGVDEGEPTKDADKSVSPTARAAEETKGDSGDTGRIVLSSNPSRNICPVLAGEVDRLRE